MPFAAKTGVQFVSADKSAIVARAGVGAGHCTAGGIAHGAFLNFPEGSKGTTTTASKANLIGAAPAGSILTITATPVSTGRRLQVWQTRTETAEGKLVSLTPQSQLNL